MLDKKRWTPSEMKARDDFAGIAMADLMSRVRLFKDDEIEFGRQRREIAKRAYQMADDMLQQRAHAFYDHEV